MTYLMLACSLCYYLLSLAAPRSSTLFLNVPYTLYYYFFFFGIQLLISCKKMGVRLPTNHLS